MNDPLQDLISRFIEGSMAADEFVDAYQAAWKKQLDTGEVLSYSDEDSEKYSTIFCMADLYNPDPDREDYEWNAERLKREISKLVGTLK